MINILKEWISEKSKEFEELNISVCDFTENEDSAFWDFLSEHNLGRIVVWEDNRMEMEVLNILTEDKIYFKYMEFNDNLSFEEKYLEEFKSIMGNNDFKISV